MQLGHEAHQVDHVLDQMGTVNALHAVVVEGPGEYIEVESARHLHVAASPSLREGIDRFARARADTPS